MGETLQPVTYTAYGGAVYTLCYWTCFVGIWVYQDQVWDVSCDNAAATSAVRTTSLAT